jgi:parvulin-like peptidyl-prolyl isomerase
VDPSASIGGVQGELSRADMPEEFAETIFGLEPGRPSDIVEADYGFHIFMVTERLPERIVPFEEASQRLRSRLWEERADARLSELVADARNRYTVRVYEQNLPFDYRGTYPTAPTGDDSEDGSAE